MREIMIDPETLGKMGLTHERIRKNFISMLKGNLSVEALDECFFRNMDEVLIQNLLEPIHKDELINFNLKIEKGKKEKYAKLKMFQTYLVVNATQEEKDLFPKMDVKLSIVSIRPLIGHNSIFLKSLNKYFIPSFEKR